VLGAPLSVKLGCKSWQQLSAIYARDLSRGAFFLKSKNPPAKGTAIRITLALPSGSAINLRGQIQAIYGDGEFDGRGPGIDIMLEPIPQSVMWLLESALSSAGLSPAPSTVGAPAPKSARLPETPTLEEGDEWITAEGDLVQSLWQELTTMSKLNPFQLLGLPLEAGDGEIRSAFGSLSKTYHPDRFARYESFEIRELANEVFMLIRDAYRSIADEAGRQKILRKLQPKEHKRAKGANLPLSPRVDEDAPTQHRGTPRRSTPPPVAEAPARDKNRLALGLGLLEGGQFRKALQILRAEARKDPPCVQAKAAVEVAEGKIALEAGDRMEAAQRFEQALDIDPSNERAAQEIAEMRRAATSQRRGLLTKLMKKG
jgi:hypothetical protein